MIDEEFAMVVVKQAVLVHLGGDVPRSAGLGMLVVTQRENVINVEEQTAWSAARGARRTGLTKRHRVAASSGNLRCGHR